MMLLTRLLTFVVGATVGYLFAIWTLSQSMREEPEEWERFIQEELR